MSEVRELNVVEEQGIATHDKDSMSVLVNVLRVSRTPDERIWLARRIEQTAFEDGWVRKEHRHPRLVNPPRWRDSQ